MPGGKLFWFPRGGIDRAGGELEDVPEDEGDEGAVEDIAVTRQGWKRRACQRDRVGKGTRKDHAAVRFKIRRSRLVLT